MKRTTAITMQFPTPEAEELWRRFWVRIRAEMTARQEEGSWPRDYQQEYYFKRRSARIKSARK